MKRSFRETVAALSPAIGVVIVYCVYRIYFVNAHIDSFAGVAPVPEIPPGAASLEDGVARFSELLSWSVTGTAFMLAFTGCGAVLLYVLRDAFKRLAAPTKLRLGVSLLVAVIAVSWVSLGDNPFAVDDLNPLLGSALERLNIAFGQAFFDAFTPMMLATTALMVGCAVAVLLIRPSGEANVGQTLKFQFHRMHVILFTGAILLVVGIVHANAVHNLPNALLETSYAEAWKKLTVGLSTSAGAIWTLILIGLYLPGIAALRLRAHAVADRAVAREESESIAEWLADHGLTFQFPQRLAQLAALVSPFVIGGPASPLLGLLGG